MHKRTFHIITIGCQMNKSDSERLASTLEKKGYRWSSDKYHADLVVVNTCGVRQSAEDRIYGLIPEIKKVNKKAKIILTGCLVNREDVKNRLKNYIDIWLPISEMAKAKFLAAGKCQNDYLKIKPKYESKFSAHIPIGNGCNNFCSYCVVPYARGREVYRSSKDILAEIRGLVKRGYKEIILIAQNVNSYKSGKTDFSDLLKMANSIPGNFWIRFLTSHPKDMSDKLIKTVAQCKKVIKEIHLPAQSGDNEILKKMNRNYTVEHYLKIIKKIKRLIPEAKISTDIIVGFPGETKKQFNNSVKLFKQIKFINAYISQYSSRPGTAAHKMADNVPSAEKKRRWLKLNAMVCRK